ncbi:Hypothetical protein D9617_11g009360 [Elsinoe fawcettii]|nr:Hypothetical protein D9617_11g009360 [Elsinoe fawcettii]
MLVRAETRHFSSQRLGRTLLLVLVPLSLLLWFLHSVANSHVRSDVPPHRAFRHAGPESGHPSSLGSKHRKGNGVTSRIGKVSGVFYDKVTPLSRAYEDALLSHLEHDDLYHYPHHVLRNKLLPGTWSREAYVYSILVQELEKPASERLDWLFWHDADVVLMNDKIPLETFLPTNDNFEHVDFIVSNDLNGLNDGIFFLRVSPWALQFMAASLAFQKYMPKVGLRYEGQSTQEILSRTRDWKNKTIHVPQRWFNSYQNYGDPDDIPPEWHWTHGYFKPGDLLVHLPGSADSRKGLLRDWLDRKRAEPEKFIIPIDKLNITRDVKLFWEKDAPNEEKNIVTYWRRYHTIQDAGGKSDDARRAAVKAYQKDAASKKASTADIEKHVKEIETKHKAIKIKAIRELYEDRLAGREEDSIEPAG